MEAKITIRQFAKGWDGALHHKEDITAEVSHETVRSRVLQGCAHSPVSEVDLWTVNYLGLEWPVSPMGKVGEGSRFKLVLPGSEIVKEHQRKAQGFRVETLWQDESGKVDLWVYGLAEWVQRRLLTDGLEFHPSGALHILVPKTTFVLQIIERLMKEEGDPGFLKLDEMYYMIGLLSAYDLTPVE